MSRLKDREKVKKLRLLSQLHGYELEVHKAYHGSYYATLTRPYHYMTCYDTTQYRAMKRVLFNWYERFENKE